MIRILLRVETALALILGWVMVFLIPIRRTCRLLGCAAVQAEAVQADAASTAASTALSARLARAEAVGRRTAFVAGRLPWHSTCLVRAVACQLLLLRRGIHGAAIRLGVRKAADGALEAHAWLLLDGAVLIGGEEAMGFVPLADLQHPRSA